MQAFLALLGLAIAAWVWSTGHPVLALIVGFLLIGGAGWMLPIWIARGAVGAVQQRPSAALATEWKRRGYPGQPQELATLLWGSSMWPSAREFLDDVAPSANHAITKFRIDSVDTPGHGTVHWLHVKVTTLPTAPIPGLNLPGIDGEGVMSCASSGAVQVMDRFTGSLYISAQGPLSWGSGRPFSAGPGNPDLLWVQVAEDLYAFSEERAADSHLARWLERNLPARRREG